jgi:hypothetical protein
MTSMQFQVPQFIETEDKVVGPFSLRQFLYVAVAAIVCSLCYFLLQTWLFIIVSIAVFGLAIALGFVKVGGRPLIKVIFAAGNFYWKPQSYIWKSENNTASASVSPHPLNAKPSGLPLEAIASGLALHKSWEKLQTGSQPAKKSPRDLVEKKMVERYQIFERSTGERTAARRVDYR